MINLKTDEDSYSKTHRTMRHSVTVTDPLGIIENIVANDGTQVYTGPKDPKAVTSFVRDFVPNTEKPLLTVTLKKEQ